MKNKRHVGKIGFCAIALLAFAGQAQAVDHYNIGLEAFTDNYREPIEDVHLNNHAIYGSVTGNYEHDLSPNSFIGVDGRLSYGRDNYKSVSGSSKNTPQYEGEFRLKLGMKTKFAGGVLSPYTGIGTRLYYDNSDNTVTTLGFGGYDRDIEQFYAPVGMTYDYPLGNSWQISPNIEYDQLIYGRVHSRLKPFVGYDVTNSQHDGYGVRGELMAGQQQKNGYGWEFGPFVRYWNIENSDVDQHGGTGWIEPKNIRLQAGLGLRFDY